MKNDGIPENFIPDQAVTIESSEDYEPFETKEVEAFSSLLDYAADILNDSEFEISAAIKGYRGQTLIYEKDSSVVAVSDDEGLGIDYFDFKGEADLEAVMEQLYDKDHKMIPGLRNDFHKTLSGDEAYDEIHKLLEAGKKY